MSASKPLQIVALAILVTAAFFVGRSSVQDRQAERSHTAPMEPERKKTLSAIPSKAEEESNVEQPKEASAPIPPVGSPQDLANAKSVSEFLATAASELDNLWDTAEIIAEWMATDPDGAIDWLASGERRNEILRVMFAIWSEADVDAASAWLTAHPDLEGYSNAAVGLAVGLVEDDQNEAALALAEKIDDPMAKSQIWTQAGSNLYDADPEATIERLANTGIPDGLQRVMVDEWINRLSNKAKRNAQNLASVYSSAIAAGAQFQGNSAAEIANEIVAGINGSDSFSTTRFQVPNMSEIELTRALENLAFEQGSLNYDVPPADE